VLELLVAAGWRPRTLGDNGNTIHYRADPV
jgi:hypothetical protein